MRKVTRLRRMAVAVAGSESAMVNVWTLSREICLVRSPAKARRRKGKKAAVVLFRALTSLRQKSFFKRLRVQRSGDRFQSIDESWTRSSKIIVVDSVDTTGKRGG